MPAKETGFQSPLDPYQIISWVISVYLIINYYLLVLPLLTIYLQYIFGIPFTIFEFLILYYGYKLTSSNPSDQIVKDYRRSVSQGLQFENMTEKFCVMCQSCVNEQSKHCMTCNRCTEGFDHHCVFANNCVGTCNYVYFVKLIVYIEVLVLINLVCCGLDLNLYIKDKEKFRQNVPVYKDPNAAISLICIDLVLVIIVVLLNGYLIAFHIHIKRKKMTTYEFICSRTHRIVPNSDRNIQDKSRSYFNSIGFESVLSE